MRVMGDELILTSIGHRLGGRCKGTDFAIVHSSDYEQCYHLLQEVGRVVNTRSGPRFCTGWGLTVILTNEL